MGWEERGNGRRYYYDSVRDAETGGVFKMYWGAEGDWVAERAAFLARARRRSAEAGRALVKAERERLEAHDAPMKELCEAADVLARAHLVVAGFHRHKGEWRRTREPVR